MWPSMQNVWGETFVMMVVAENIHVFTFWLSLTFLTLLFSVHVVSCVHAVSLVERSKTRWLLAWKAGTTIQEAGTYLVDKSRSRISHQMHLNEGHLCSIINQMEWKQSLCRRGQTCGKLRARQAGWECKVQRMFVVYTDCRVADLCIFLVLTRMGRFLICIIQSSAESNVTMWTTK